MYKSNPVLRVFLFVVLALLALLWSYTGSAQDAYTVYRLPKGRRVSVAGEVLQGYTLEQQKSLLLMDSDLRTADLKLVNLNAQLLEQKSSMEQLRITAALDQKELVLLYRDLERKDRLLTETVKKSLELQEQLTFRKRLLRIGGTVAGALVGGLVLGLVLGSK